MEKENECGIIKAMFVIILIAFTIVLFLIFICPPISHYWEKWSEYWDSSAPQASNLSQKEQDESDKYWQRQSAAYKDCSARAKKYFGTDHVASNASSTSAVEYETYDCYGVKFTKIQ